jgi:DNA-binding NarL/FixJ family response regulator
MFQVAIVDDCSLTRKGMAAILATAPDIRSTELSGDALLRHDWAREPFDAAIVMISHTHDRPALPAVAALAARLPVLLVAPACNATDAAAALQAGASGYLTTRADDATILRAVRVTAGGGLQFNEWLPDDDLAQEPQPDGHEANPLSPREQEALRYIARGYTHQQTARRMGVSKTTVNTYVARIRQKLRVGNKAELTIAALRYLEAGGSNAGTVAQAAVGVAAVGIEAAVGAEARPGHAAVADVFAAVPWDVIDEAWWTPLRRGVGVVTRAPELS